MPPSDPVLAWKSSPAHDDVIKDPEYNSVGIGYALSSSGATYYVAELEYIAPENPSVTDLEIDGASATAISSTEKYEIYLEGKDLPAAYGDPWAGSLSDGATFSGTFDPNGHATALVSMPHIDGVYTLQVQAYGMTRSLEVTVGTPISDLAVTAPATVRIGTPFDVSVQASASANLSGKVAGVYVDGNIEAGEILDAAGAGNASLTLWDPGTHVITTTMSGRSVSTTITVTGDAGIVTLPPTVVPGASTSSSASRSTATPTTTTRSTSPAAAASRPEAVSLRVKAPKRARANGSAIYRVSVSGPRSAVKRYIGKRLVISLGSKKYVARFPKAATIPVGVHVPRKAGEYRVVVQSARLRHVMHLKVVKQLHRH